MIQETKNLMNEIAKLVTASFVCATKVSCIVATIPIFLKCQAKNLTIFSLIRLNGKLIKISMPIPKFVKPSTIILL